MGENEKFTALSQEVLQPKKSGLSKRIGGEGREGLNSLQKNLAKGMQTDPE